MDIIFHLAAVVSSAAESNYDLGITVNIDGLTHILKALEQRRIRISEKDDRVRRPPVLVFASSVAVYGPPPIGGVTDETSPCPQSSYGTQKAIGELLIADASRRQSVDGR